MLSDKRKQVADQCRVIAHLAGAIHEVYSDKARLFASDATGPDELVELVGNWSAAHMEKLGDILNGMDAVDESDEWTAPIFKKAHELWPQADPAAALNTPASP